MIQRVNINTQYDNNNNYGGTYAVKDSHKMTALRNTPLRKNEFSHPSFKAAIPHNSKGLFKPIINRIPHDLKLKAFESLDKLSSYQRNFYTEIQNEYIHLVKTEKKFRKMFSIPDDVAKNIDEEHLFYTPQKKLFANFISHFTAPFVAAGKAVRRLFTPAKEVEMEKHFETVMKEYSSFESLIKSHEIWENGYRKLAGYKLWEEKNEFIIPEDVLLTKLKRRRHKFVDPKKGKYSTTSLMLGNRFISGSVYAYFLGTDAYNTTMRYSNDKEEAASQRKTRVAQEFSRIGLNMYIQNLLLGTFEASVNKSLPTALLVSGSTVAASEILGRKLVGKPIMPSDKEHLDKLEKEMSEKKGFLPAIGRLLTRDKNKIARKLQAEKSGGYSHSKPNEKAFNAFIARKPRITNNDTTGTEQQRPSFKGFFRINKYLEREKLYNTIKILEKADERQARFLKENLLSLNKADWVTKMSRVPKQLGLMFENSEVNLLKNAEDFMNLKTDYTFELMMKDQSMKKVILGKEKTIWGQLFKSVTVPFTWLKSLYKGVKEIFFDIYLRCVGKYQLKKIIKMKDTFKENQLGFAMDFSAFYKQRLTEKAWIKSELSETEKKVRIFYEFMETRDKRHESAEGIKNMILWLEDRFSKADIKLKPDGTLDENDFQKVKKCLKDAVMRADNDKQAEYDGNKIAQANINIARAITTVFLVTDAYNLTMQYSGDNRKDAAKSAKNRAAQEASRIGVSAYMLAFVHNLLSRLCNSSLAGAFSLTAMTSVINDSISRQVVGVPLAAKTQDELYKIDKQNAKSQNPIKKALAYSMGKKQHSKQSKEKVQQDYFSNDFFIKPEIV